MIKTNPNPEYDGHVMFGELTSDWLRQHKDQLDWSEVCRYQKLEESLMDQLYDYVDWPAISYWQIHLSQNFIRRHWWDLSKDQLFRTHQLSQSLIREFLDHINLDFLVQTHELSINFIRQFSDNLDWVLLKKSQCYFKYDFNEDWDKYKKEFSII